MKKIFLILSLIILSSCGNKQETPIQGGNTNTNPDIQNKQQIILALGDSLTAGYNLDIKESYPLQLEGLLEAGEYNYRVQNAGVSGDTSKNLLDRIELYDDIDADIYLLGIGANDGLRLQSIEQMSTNINAIIDHLQDINPDAKIVLQGMQMPLNVGIEYADEFKNTFEDISEQQNTYYYDFLLQDVATIRALNLSDGIHPNEEGYSIIAQNIFNFLEEKEIIIK